MSDAIDMLIRMAQNNAWANARLYDRMSDMDAATFAAPRPGFFGSIKATLNHIHQADLYYIDALEQGGQGRSVYATDEISDVPRLAAAQAATDARLIRFCTGLSPDMLDDIRHTERREGIMTETVRALLPHLFQHQVHHRGQAHVMLQDAGIAPPQLDEFHLDYDRHPAAQAYFT
ncbi:DinB family protein [uncultured Tateyamaria sp.]|uniref:DinB family protein n=1 Tax=Tateyamaria sp. 1078 TaxID=3417464 RepID=UPI0026288579|nr:DinB family protein [uncultured Tateyamaria sp.]